LARSATALYLAMAYALYRILSTPPSKARRWAILAFAGQLALICAGPSLFSAPKSYARARGVVAMEAAIIATIFLFRPPR